jgi:beta-galactosidase
MVSDTVSTPGVPAALKLVLDESGRLPKAGVNDALFVYAVIIDKEGNKVPVNDVTVKFTVSGDAAVINPGSISMSEAGIATALICIGENPGEIEISARAVGLESVKIRMISY